MRDSPELSGELVLAGFFIAGNIQESRDMAGLLLSGGMGRHEHWGSWRLSV
jgi:hypothetical protein